MSRNAALLVWIVFTIWALLRDSRHRPAFSAALWLPVLWLSIISSRPISIWLTGATPVSGAALLEGNALDRFFFLLIPALCLIVLQRRAFDWGSFAGQNRPLLILYCYLLFSALWAISPFASF